MDSHRLQVGLVIDGSDRFLRPVERELGRRHAVRRFAPRFVRLPLVGARLNEWLLDRQLQRFLRRHDVLFFEWAGSLLVRMSNLPQAGKVIARLHSVELATSAEQINWARIDRVIVLNAAIEARLQMLVRQPLPPVVMVANGVDMERFKPRPRQFQHRLGMVCNLLPIKRVYEVVLCVHQLRQEGYPFTLQVAGRPMDRERRYDWALRALVQELGLTESVRFSGWVDDVAAWLGHIDVFISNSYWEGQQTALLEAMASGCYCLAHCWAGVEEVLPLENVFVTDGDLCQKLVSYAGLAEAGKERAQAEMRRIAEERFDERRMVAELIAVIEAVARGTA